MMSRKTVMHLSIALAWVLSYWVADAPAAERPVASLPPYLAESGIPTQREVDLTGEWLAAMSSAETGKRSPNAWVDQCLGTAPPFSFQCNGKEFPSMVGDWKLERTEPKREGDVQTRDVSWTDPKTGLKVTWHIKRMMDYPAVEWRLSLENTGKEEVSLQQVAMMNVVLRAQDAKQPCIVRGAKGGRTYYDDMFPETWSLGNGAVPISLGGSDLPSNVNLPFWSLQTPEGCGVMVGVGAGGWWRADVVRNGEKLVCKVTGPDKGAMKIAPNQKCDTARVLVSLWKGKEWLHGHNMFRRLLHAHYVPLLRGELQKPLVSVNVCYTHHGHGWFLEAVTERDVLNLIEPCSQLGVELLLIDAGWYSRAGQIWAAVKNNWTINPEKYPHGFKRIVEQLRAKGIDFGVWMSAPTAAAETAAFLDRVDDLVKNEGMTCYRQDMTPTNRKVLDAIRQRYPNLIMEGCCAGGRNIDLETLCRFHWHQKSDYRYHVFSDQVGLYGANLFLPGGLINVPTLYTNNFGAWSGFAGQFCLAWHPLDKDFPMEKARKQVALYKRIRPLLAGDYYPLTERDELEYWLYIPWLAYQFHRTDLDEGFALIFKRTTEKGDTFRLALRGLNPEARYASHFQASGAKAVYAGAELSKGIDVNIAITPDVEMVIYEKQP